MSKNISFVIPYKPSTDRERLYNFTRERVAKLFPMSELIVSVYNKEPFSRSIALNHGVKNATKEIVVLLDADIIFDKNLIEKSLDLLSISAWVIPFDSYCYLDLETTNNFLNLDYDFSINEQFPFKACIHRHTLGAMNIIKKADYEKIGGFDERLVDWGFDDNVFAHKADVILGEYKRTKDRVFHLYHERNTSWNNPNTEKNKQIYNEIKNYTTKQSLLNYLKNI
jgi:glycosyltransferase involved in cell wall biosynthesis